MRTGKALGLALGCALALVLLAMAALSVFVHPNDYRPRLAAAVRTATGRDLDLKGDLRLSVFPWLALELGPASLGNRPGFDGPPFLSFKHASVRVHLLPLLAKRLEVGRVEVDGLELRLARNAQGQGNWQGFGGPSAAPGNSGLPANRPSPAGVGWAGIAAVRLKDARVTYEQITLEDVDIETGAIARQVEVPVTLHFTANRGVRDEQVSVDARFDVRVDPGTGHVTVAALNLNGAAQLAAHARTDHFGAAAAALDIGLEQQTVAIPAITLNTDGAVATASLEARSLGDSPRVTGTVTLTPLVLREWLARWGWTVPATRDPKAWSSLAASTRFEYADQALRLTELAATLDDTRVKGSATLVGADHRFSFELAMDRIDVDRYRPPATLGSPTAAGESPPAANSRAARGSASGDPKALPWQADGTLTVGSVQVASLALENVHVTVATQDEVTRLYPLTGEIEGGRYSGDITVDRRAPIAVVSFDEHLSGVDVGRFRAQDSGQVRLSGRASLDFKATGRGAGADEVLRTLDGQVRGRITDGALEGVDLDYQLGRAEALLRAQSAGSVPDTGRTPVEALQVSAQITRGVATTHDLLISTRAFKITGQGTASLVTQALDLGLLADLKSSSGTLIQLPVKVRGSFIDPDIRPDLQALARGELKEKVKDLLKKRLKDLFGPP